MDCLFLASEQDWGHENGGAVAPRDKEPPVNVTHSEFHTRSPGIPNSGTLGIRMALQVSTSSPYSHAGNIYYTVTLRLEKKVTYLAGLGERRMPRGILAEHLILRAPRIAVPASFP